MDPSTKFGTVLADEDGATRLVYYRDLDAPIDEVWSWLTDYAKLARWIGQCDGDAAPGSSIHFRATTDRVEPGTPARVETIHIDTCRPPHRVALDWVIPGYPLARVEADLAQVPGRMTILRLAHHQVDPTRCAKIGAGWHYLLDRLEAAWAGQPLPTWPGYLNIVSPVYVEMAARVRW